MEDRENQKENPVLYLDGALQLSSNPGLNTLDKGFSIRREKKTN